MLPLKHPTTNHLTNGLHMKRPVPASLFPGRDCDYTKEVKTGLPIQPKRYKAFSEKQILLHGPLNCPESGDLEKSIICSTHILYGIVGSIVFAYHQELLFYPG